MSDNTIDMFPDELPEKNCAIDNSPASIAQRERFLRALRLDTVNTIEARELLNIMHPEQHIIELEALGYVIGSNRRRAIDLSGNTHNLIEHYTLIYSPDHKTPPQSVASPTGSGERGANDGE